MRTHAYTYNAFPETGSERQHDKGCYPACMPLVEGHPQGAAALAIYHFVSFGQCPQEPRHSPSICRDPRPRKIDLLGCEGTH